MNDLLQQFVIEARDLLQEAGEDLLSLERSPTDEAAINRLFRSVHTLKGSSGLFDAQPLTRVLHAAEDLFQAVREGRLALTAAMVDAGFKTFDQAGRWIDELERQECLSEACDPIVRALVAELRAQMGGQMDGPAGGEPAPEPAAPAAAPPGLARWFDEKVRRAAAAAGGTLCLISYAPEAGCFFKGEDPLHLALQIPRLHALRTEPRAPWGRLTDLDPYHCNVDFHALSAASRAELDKLFRYVPDQVSITELPAEALLAGAGPAPAAGDTAALPAMVVALLKQQVALLQMPAPEAELAGRIGAAARVAANAMAYAARPEAAAAIHSSVAVALAKAEEAGLAAAITALLAAHGAGPQQAATPARSTVNPPGGAGAAEPERVVPRTLRVDQEKVDMLMNLVGELVVAKNSLPFLARRAEHHFGLRELGREIKDQYSVIDRIAQELQGAVMSVRMMPVGQVFQRFPRLVRDLSQRLGKKVELVIEGEATEADKNVIETLFDPLLHMVRNSLDHGIEPPDKRVAVGKPAAAAIRLSACHEGDQVVIQISDDGRGIDPEVIKRKAYERGLLDEARLDTITDDEATMLVFAAGFSTAETISDVSGRGVGMDAVRSAVEKAGGRIALSSTKGAGTNVRLNLPLSMAVSRVMTVALDERLFGVPMDLIHETVKIPRRDVVRIKHNEAFVLRDRVIPLLHLAHLLDLPDRSVDSEEVAILVVRVAGQTIGLGITAFGEGMEVILKPLEGMLAKIAGYSGTALLGDGRVLLVLDLKELIP
jgi:two-component system chemotaxis sensor kinase CheA